jgi:beta-phosphoglucomutase-like phosphatase (HAD superfamily)
MWKGFQVVTLFLPAAELLSVSPGRCVVLEDTQIGLDAAMTVVDVRPYRDEP